jgi:hypothetical protein
LLNKWLTNWQKSNNIILLNCMIEISYYWLTKSKRFELINNQNPLKRRNEFNCSVNFF